MPALSPLQIQRIVDQYVGVNAGNLIGFSYKSLNDFYRNYCELDIDFANYNAGTKRELFIEVLRTAPLDAQAKILRGVVEKILPSGLGAPITRTETLRAEILTWAGILEATLVVPAPTLKAASDVVKRALADAETLINESDAVSAVDRVHTAFHGYVLSICRAAGITARDESSFTSIFKALCTQHPKLVAGGPHREAIEKIVIASSTIIDSVNYLRNNASVAHPNDNLIANNHAQLVVNVCRSLLHYLDSILA